MALILGLILFVLGLVLLGLAIFMNAWVEKRRFYRRNDAGIEEFDGYWASKRSELAERGATFLGACALLSGLYFIGTGGIAILKFMAIIDP